MLKSVASIFIFGTLFLSCKSDKPLFADLYVIFDYNGSKIDSTTTEKDQIIFTNFDGSPIVNVPNYYPDGCANKTLVGTFAIGDTIKWHLRLVSTDGGPQLFQMVMNSDREPVPIQSSLHFYNPAIYNFEVNTEICDDQMVVVIGN